MDYETRTLAIKRKKTINKIFLGCFILLMLFTILGRASISIAQDLGFAEGKLHIGFWSNPQNAFHDEYIKWARTASDPNWTNFLEAHKDIKSLIINHPNFFWPSTQFTWLTTYITFIFMLLRFFKYEGRLPSWLKWIMTQKTLTLLTSFEVILGVVFWAGLFANFAEGFKGSLGVYQLIITIFVHGIIPILLCVYSLIFLIYDKKASFLRESFPLKGMVYPTIYSLYYIMLTVVWQDPYAVTDMHDALTSSKEGDWGAWASQLWKLPIALLCIYILVGLVTVMHNVFLILFNSKYSPKKDTEAIARHKEKILELEKYLIKNGCGKKWRKHYKDFKKHK